MKEKGLRETARVTHMINEELIGLMVRRIVDGFAPQQIVVFGSCARGDDQDDSDLDLLVVMPFAGTKRDVQVAMRMALRDFDVPVDLILASPQEIEQKRDVNGLIYRTAYREGRIAYERAG